jgi:hypothetical protein
MRKWVPRPACQPGLFMKQALLMVRFQGSKQAFKVRNQVDILCIALRHNNSTWIDHGCPDLTADHPRKISDDWIPNNNKFD